MPFVPILAAVGGGSAVAGGVGLATTALGAVQANQAKKAAQSAAAQASAVNPTVDIAALQKQAQAIAQENARNSALLEQQYNPGAAQLRKSSLRSVIDSLPRSAQTQLLADQIAEQAGSMPTGIGYDSPLLREAISKASSDLALGGQLPQDVRNLVARGALARSGSVTGNLNLGRDLMTRDLGLTSLDLENRRLQNASALGQQEASLGQGNAQLSLQAQLAGKGNLFDSANFLAGLDSGDFARQFSAAQLGQNIAMPVSGLDPGSVANLAVGNSNATAQAQQQAAAIAAQQANQKSQLGSQLLGTGLGMVSNYFKPTTPSLLPASGINTITSPKVYSSYA